MDSLLCLPYVIGRVDKPLSLLCPFYLSVQMQKHVVRTPLDCVSVTNQWCPPDSPRGQVKH